MTRLLWLAAAVVLLFTTSATAQTVEREINLAALGWGAVEAWPIDTDGHPETEEWLVRAPATPFTFITTYRVVAVREDARDGLCIGDWFNPRATTPYAKIALMRLGRVDKLRVDEPGTLRIVSLDTPPCER